MHAARYGCTCYMTVGGIDFCGYICISFYSMLPRAQSGYSGAGVYGHHTWRSLRLSSRVINRRVSIGQMRQVEEKSSLRGAHAVMSVTMKSLLRCEQRACARSVCEERVRGACAGSMCVERARGLRSVQRVRRTAKRGREHGLHYTVSICDTVPPPSTRQSAPRPSRSQIGALRARSRWIDEWKIDLAYACRQSANDSERDDNIFEAVGRWQHILRVELARIV